MFECFVVVVVVVRRYTTQTRVQVGRRVCREKSGYLCGQLVVCAITARTHCTHPAHRVASSGEALTRLTSFTFGFHFSHDDTPAICAVHTLPVTVTGRTLFLHARTSFLSEDDDLWW